MADLTDAEETALIEIMTASIKQAAFGHGPTGRVVKKVSSLCSLIFLLVIKKASINLKSRSCLILQLTLKFLFNSTAR